jgi:putative SOS response-associated peptidase YedK
MTVRQFSARVDGASTDFVWVCPCDEPDPRDSMRPFPAEPMRMWPISTRVNEPENDDPSIVEPIEQAAAIAWRSR